MIRLHRFCAIIVRVPNVYANMRYFRKINRLKWLIIASIIFAILGLILDWKGFLVNTFSGVLGAAIGVWVSVDVVERYFEDKHRQEWQNIRINSQVSIQTQLFNIADEYVNWFFIKEPFLTLIYRNNPSPQEIATAIGELRKRFANLQLGTQDKTNLRNLYKNVNQHMSHITFTRAMYMHIPSFDKQLVDQLQNLERDFANWTNAIQEDDRIGLQTRILFDEANKFLLLVENTIIYFIL